MRNFLFASLYSLYLFDSRNVNRINIRLMACAALAVFLCGCGGEPARLRLEKARIIVGGRKVSVEIAARPNEQARGLMFRRSLGEDEGMLFVYDSPRLMSFWMKNTRIPLSIAFIDGGGTIVRIETMTPYDTVSRHNSKVPVRYALEMNRGWFDKNGVGVGDKVDINEITNNQ